MANVWLISTSWRRLLLAPDLDANIVRTRVRTMFALVAVRAQPTSVMRFIPHRNQGEALQQRMWTRRVTRPVIAVVMIALLGAGCGGSTKASSGARDTTTSAASKTSRGFDGKTVTVAGMGIKAQFPGAELGA